MNDFYPNFCHHFCNVQAELYLSPFSYIFSFWVQNCVNAEELMTYFQLICQVTD